MNKYRVCVYAICKNEEAFVDRWMDSMSEADLVIVTDTGSTDATVEKLKSRGAVVYEETISPWRFDVARNVSLSRVPDDVDIAVCTDLDEVLRPGWRDCLEQAWTPGTHMGNYLYNWSLNPDGTPDTQFIYFKVHAPFSYMWSCPVHEYLRYTGLTPEKKVFIEGMVLDHYPDPAKSRSSYLPLLTAAVEEEPLNARMVYYLGREYMYNSKWDDCIRTLTGYLELPSANWAEERCAAMRWIAKSYFRKELTTEAYRWYYRAAAELPSMRDAYIECAMMAYTLKDWDTVFYMTAVGLKIKEKSKSYVNMGHAWNHIPDDLAAIACYHLGLYQLALTHAASALSHLPNDQRLKNNFLIIKQKCK